MILCGKIGEIIGWKAGRTDAPAFLLMEYINKIYITYNIY